MNRYEILIGKELLPEPPKLPPKPLKVREILHGKRRSGKTFELINCIRKTVVKGITPLVCLSHKPDYFLEMLGSLVDHVYLISAEGLERDRRGLGDIKVFYYDDFDLVRLPSEKSSLRNPFGLEKYSLDRRFVEMDEIVVTCDVQEIWKYRQISYLDYMPEEIRAGFNTWKVIDIPRRSNDMTYIFNNSYQGNFV